MKLEHKFVVPAPVEQTWAAFNDLERVVPCFPGATLTGYEGDDFTGSCKVKLGPVSLQYSGTGSFVERDESDHHAVIEARGKDRRGNGTATARVTARLAGSSDGSTEVTVDTDLTITGRPAQFGRGLIQDVSNKLLDQFTTCLKSKLNQPPTEAKAEHDDSAGTVGGQSAGTARENSAGTARENSAGTAHGEPAKTERENPVGAVGDESAGSAPEESAGTVREESGGTGRESGRTGREESAEAEAVALDLGSTLLPMLAKRAAPYLIGAVLALVLRRLFRR
ncbi:SRPBCC family protein [Kribbella sp. NPDC048928]|uniref:SRPBCC family protein n=1 Tax=Kribbella sp. NPDC048928 TaxID=3364111 RepID=UPI0037228452